MPLPDHYSAARLCYSSPRFRDSFGRFNPELSFPPCFVICQRQGRSWTIFNSNVREGDVVISSDPYAGGTVLTDLTLLTPVFLDGDLKFFVEVRFRLSDLSGAVAGGFHPWASEIWEEGVRITPIKLVSRGLLQEDILEAILINMRSPTTTRHDIRACVAACRWGGRAA